MRLVYLMLETTQCFLKRARDLCVLIAERSEVYYKINANHHLSTPYTG